jgi:gliding motility-associated-like protein
VQDSTTVTITKAPAATISYPTNNLCNVVNSITTPNPPVNVSISGTKSGTFFIMPSAGLAINAQSGQINPSGASPGTYTIYYVLIGSGSCSNDTATTSVVVSSSSFATISYPDTLYCSSVPQIQSPTVSGTSGGLFSASPAGLSIDANTGAINPSLSVAGSYTVSYNIAASSPCPGFSTTTSVKIVQTPIISFSKPNQSACSGSTISYTPTSNILNNTYNWSVVGSLPNGVSGITSGVVSGNNPINISFTNSTQASQTIQIQVVATNNSPGACISSQVVLTAQINPIPPKVPSDTTAYCMQSGSFQLTVQGVSGDTIKWYDINQNLLPSAPTINTNNAALYTFYVTQTNVYGCTSQESVQIAQVHITPKIIGSAYNNPDSCGIPSGSVVLTVLDLNGNPIVDSPVVVYYTEFQTPYHVSDSTDNTGKITIPLTAGVYSNFYVETFGCASQKIPNVFELKDPNPPSQPLAGYNPPVCTGSPLNLSASSATSGLGAPVSYVWAGPAFGALPDTTQNTVTTFNPVTNNDQGTYVVYAIQNNCISAATSFVVNVSQGPSKPQIVTKSPLCVGETLNLQAYSSIEGNDTLSYVWNGPGSGFPINNPFAQINNVQVKDGGIYTVTVSSNQTGCSISSDTLIQVGGYPIIKFNEDSLTVPTGYSINLTPIVVNADSAGIIPIQRYAWTPNQGIVCIDSICSSVTFNASDNACYTVTATNIYGCAGADTLCVKVFCKSAQVFIPNAFTPHGPIPENTKLIVRSSGVASVKSFRIFDRWGRIVFERANFQPNDGSNGWDGTINGKMADTGVYVYIVEVICENGVVYEYKGNVTLL